MEGSSLSCFVPFEVLRVMMTLVTILLPEARSSRYSVFNYVISPSHTSFVSLILMPIERLKFSISTSVFFTSEENTYEATMGQKGTLGPSSCAMASAMAVLPVPGGPARSSALPAIFFDLMRSTATPAASLARACPTMPCEISLARPSSLRPSPLMCVWVETRCVLVVERTYSICVGRAVP